MTGQTKCEQCPLRLHDVFLKVDDEQLGFIARFKTGELVVDPGATILLEENNSPHLYTILDGWAFRHKQLEDGRRQILNFALPGDLIGLQAAILSEMQHSVTALTRATLCVFQRDKIWTLFQEFPELSFSMTWLAAREEQMLDGHLLSLGQRTALERTAYYILHLYDRAAALGLAGNNALCAPFSKGHLAEAMGITAVHASRTIRKLHERALIRWTDDTIIILDRDRLQALASFESDPAMRRPMI